MRHLTLKPFCQLLTHLGEEGRDELHPLRRRLRLHQGLASVPTKNNISSATTSSKSRASFLPFIVIWKTKKYTNKKRESQTNELKSFKESPCKKARKSGLQFNYFRQDILRKYIWLPKSKRIPEQLMANPALTIAHGAVWIRLFWVRKKQRAMQTWQIDFSLRGNKLVAT